MVDFIIREAGVEDLTPLYKFAERMKINNETYYFDKCLDEVQHNKRIIVLAESKTGSRIIG